MRIAYSSTVRALDTFGSRNWKWQEGNKAAKPEP